MRLHGNLPSCFAIPLLLMACCHLAATRALANDGEVIRAEIDATNISRHLLHAKLTYHVSPGEFVLWFPKWIPGIHGPAGNIGNVAGLLVTTPDGDHLEWQRDPDELYRFVIRVPEGTSSLA